MKFKMSSDFSHASSMSHVMWNDMFSGNSFLDGSNVL
jgi:hypothetical protein